MSPDMLTAYVLWSAHPDCEGEAQYELQSRSVHFALVTLSSPMHDPRGSDFQSQADVNVAHQRTPCADCQRSEPLWARH